MSSSDSDLWEEEESESETDSEEWVEEDGVKYPHRFGVYED